MRSWLAAISLVALLASTAALSQVPEARPGQPGWTRVSAGCFVWNASPQAGEVVAWDGQCRNSRTDGTGTLTWNSEGKSSRYEGAMRDGRQHGQGTLKYSDGGLYKGDFVDGRRQGRGAMTYANGARYDGEWQAGQRHGKGVLTFADGSSFDGSFAAGKAEGPGTFIVKGTASVYQVTAKDGCAQVGNNWFSIGGNLAQCQR